MKVNGSNSGSKVDVDQIGRIRMETDQNGVNRRVHLPGVDMIYRYRARVQTTHRVIQN